MSHTPHTPESDRPVKLSRLARAELVAAIERVYKRCPYLPDNVQAAKWSHPYLVREAACLLGHEATFADFRRR